MISFLFGWKRVQVENFCHAEPLMGHRRDPESARVQAVFRFSRFSSAYRSRLLAGLLDVQSFLREATGLSLQRVLSDPNLANEVLGCYVMSRHETHPAKSLSTVKHGLLGCQHLRPTIKGRLLTPWENLRVWEERKTTQLRPPLPAAIWCVMVGLARGHGLPRISHINLNGFVWPPC